MKASVILGLIIVLGIGVGIFFLYNYVEKPKIEEDMKYNNLSIQVISNDIKVEKDYILFVNGVKNIEGRTLKDGFIKQQLQLNQSFDIYIEDFDIYTSRVSYPASTSQQTRVEVPVETLGNIVLSHSGVFWSDNPLNITLNVTGRVKNPIMCFRWSMNLINVETPSLNMVEIDLPERIVADRCYYLNSSIKDEIQTIPVYYTKFGTYSEDYINVIIYDGDIMSFSNNQVIYENTDKKDIFMNDTIYSIKV